MASTTIALSATAQDYNSLWKQAEAEARNDLPKSAIEIVKTIHDKALEEKNTAELLRSMLMLRTYSNEFSPDSAQVYTDNMEALLKNEKDPIIKALLHSALAQCYIKSEEYIFYDNDEVTADEKRKKANEHFKASIAEPEVLANCNTSKYKPLFDCFKDSKLFNNDLLQVLLDTYIEDGNLKPREKCELLNRMADFYKQRQQDNAAVLLYLRAIKEKYDQHSTIKGRIEDNAQYKDLVALIRAYNHTESVVEVYNEITELHTLYSQKSVAATHNNSLLYDWAEKGDKLFSGIEGNKLRNFKAQITQPTAIVENIEECAYPGDKLTLNYKLRNLKNAEIRIIRLFDSRIDYINRRDYDLKKLAAKHKPVSITSWEISEPAAPYAWNEGKIELEIPTKPGIYYVELTHNGKHLSAQELTVTALTAMTFSTPDGGHRITVVDTHSGRPIENSQIIEIKESANKYRSQKTYKTDKQGTVYLKGNYKYDYIIAHENDKVAEVFYLYNQSSWNHKTAQQAKAQIFTDRAIYRPGQKVEFSGVVYDRNEDEYTVKPDIDGEVKLFNTNQKEIDSVCVRTDDMGSFSGSFTLPEQCLPGRFCLSFKKGGVEISAFIDVEEYKRPTFTATTNPIKTAYALGDHVKITGKAKTYSGIPISNARVQYHVNRSMWFVWNDDDFEAQSGETTTDAEGRFELPVWLAKNVENESVGRYNRYTYTVSYTVTAENGETTQGSTALTVATRPTYLSAQVPNTICRSEGKDLPSFSIKQLNAAGEQMEAKGQYTLVHNNKTCAEGAFVSGEPFVVKNLANLPSGKYKMLYSTAEAEEDSIEFLLFSDTDKQPADCDTPLFFYQEMNEAKDRAKIVIGSPCKDAVLFYDIVCEDKIVESKLIELHNELQRIDFNYKSEYGDGATLHLAMWRDEKLYTHEVKVIEPIPEKKLNVSWKTFRSRLTPGQEEQWVLQVTKPDGTPANAQIMACLYDASLDAFANNTWQDFDVTFPRYLSNSSWNHNWQSYRNNLQGAFNQNLLKQQTIQFTCWKNELFYFDIPYVRAYGVRRFQYKGIRAASKEMAPMYDMAAIEAVCEKSIDISQANEKLERTNATSATAAPTVTPRTNFAETAFFRPALRTNAQGEVNIAFTLPESMTQWNFCALAHTQYMDYGRLNATVVARKEFMVEPALPRFMRKGDKTDLPVKVTNLSDKEINAKLQLSLTDAANNATKFNAQQKVTLAPGESKVYTFAYDATKTEGVMVCRTVAEGSGFSDGEEHYLPILTTDVEVTRTLPFSLTEKGVCTLQTDTLFDTKNATHRALSVEISSNPTWYAVTTLATLTNQKYCLSADEWATRFYALTIGQYLGKKCPEIKQMAEKKDGVNGEAEKLTALKLEGLTDATPWLNYAEDEKKKAAALRQLFDEEAAAANLYTAIDKLKMLQQSNGAFSWYPGMPGNVWTTIDVVTLLARSKQLTQYANRQTTSMLDKAFDFLKKEIATYVKQHKQHEKKVGHMLEPSEYAMRYLYVRTLLNKNPDADANYLLDRAEELRHEFTMYGKAVTAVVLAKANRKAKAELTLKSLMEHTVSKKQMGRYFDTNRALWSWTSYRIPTQCIAIEALQLFGRQDEANEMRLWLMQSKRTQMWETSRATSDAVYILLNNINNDATIMPLHEQTPIYYTLLNHKKTIDANAKDDSQTASTVGYVKKTYTDEDAVNATSIKLDKRTEGLSWGSVYATFMAPASQVQTEGKGLQLTRRFEVKVGNEWKPVTNGTKLQKGDHVRQIFKLTADRDYDFVSLNAARPACLEPAQPLSGYDWNLGLPAYRAVHDSSTDYFIEHVRKGTHQFTEELFVDRTGQFATGISRIECVYAPEFCGTAAETTISVKK